MPSLLSLQAATILSFWVKTSARSVKLEIILSLSSNLFLQGLEETKTRVYRDTTVVCQTLQKCQIVILCLLAGRKFGERLFKKMKIK